MIKLNRDIFKNKRILVLMFAVVVPAITISLIAVFSILQQRKTREIRLKERLTRELIHLRTELKNELEDTIKVTFQQVGSKVIDFNETGSIQRLLKDVLLKNRVVKYPFLINSDNRFIFPFSKSPAPLIFNGTDRWIFSKTNRDIFIKGENLEFKERQFFEALKYYLKCLKKNPTKEEKLNLYYSIGRCYFKLNKLPQAVSYLAEIERMLSSLLKKNYPFYFSILRQTALSFKQMNMKAEALRTYLHLYEQILEYEASIVSDRFSFFKNEALDYLNVHMKKGYLEGKRFKQAKIMDKLEQATKLDIALRWHFYDVSDYTDDVPDEDKNVEKSRFYKIQDFYTPNDEKTQFYKGIKELIDWKTKGDVESSDVDFTHPVPELPFSVAFKKISRDRNNLLDIFFGFTFAKNYVNSEILPRIIKRHFNSPGLKVFLLDRGSQLNQVIRDLQYKYEIITVPLLRFFPENVLQLVSNQKNYFENRIRTEILINHGLITVLILTFILSIFLFYKYLTREMAVMKLKSNFVDSASHTLKTPLTRIRMLVEKLQLGWISRESKREDYFQTILSEADRMNEMINNMLDFSKIEAGKKNYDFKRMSIQAVVKELLNKFSFYLKSLGFQFNTEIDTKVSSFLFDPGAVKLIVINLLQNAVKYSLKEKTIGVKLYQQNDQVVIEIEDRGIGIEEKDLSNIFIKFFRVENIKVKTLEGSGLGLYLVKHAVNAHKGEIMVKSELDKGSIFTVFLPMNGEKE